MLLKPWSCTPTCETCDAICFTVLSRPRASIDSSPVASKCRKAIPNWKPCVHSVQPRDVYFPFTVKTGVPFDGSHAAFRARIFSPASSNTRVVFFCSFSGVRLGLIFMGGENESRHPGRRPEAKQG